MKWLAIPVILSLALAGCSTDDSADGTEPTVTQTTTQDQNGTTNPGTNKTQENRAPSIALTADRDAGAAPFNVTFRIDGEDPDGDALSWTLFINGTDKTSGHDVPANVTVAFDSPGDFNVTVTLSDGNVTASASLTITASAGTPAYDGPAPIVFSGSTTAPSATYQAGEGCWLEYPAVSTGDGYNMQGDRSGWIYAVEPSNAYAALFYDSDNVGSTGEGTGGVVPGGSHYVDICGTGPGAVDNDYTFTAWHPDHPDAPVA